MCNHVVCHDDKLRNSFASSFRKSNAKNVIVVSLYCSFVFVYVVPAARQYWAGHKCAKGNHATKCLQQKRELEFMLVPHLKYYIVLILL